MSMMWPPHNVKMVSTPSFLSAFATRCPPETTAASRLLGCKVLSAVVVAAVVAAAEDAGGMVSPRWSTGSRARRARGGAARLSVARRGLHWRAPARDRFVLHLGTRGGKVLDAHRLQHEQAERGGQQVEAHRDHEDGVPAHGYGKRGGKRHQQRAHAFGGVEH